MIGLGTLAIGRLWQGFVQNAPDTAGYSRAIMSGHFATARGLAFSANDHVRGRIIEELMCNLDCNIDQIADECGHGHETFQREFEALLPFVTDGFARLDGRRIIVDESGRPYLRLIAAIFDSYLADSRARHSGAV